MQTTPNANRTHITFLGKTNSGKSSLINAISGQDIALVSEVKGTTTDPVYKTMELHPLGPCLLIDTAGFDDTSTLGEARIMLTKQVIDKTDIAVLLFSDGDFTQERQWVELLRAKNIPVIFALNKTDIIDADSLSFRIEKTFGQKPVCVSAKEKQNISSLLDELSKANTTPETSDSICGHLVNPFDIVLLVMPQDIQAPKGRLILPQVQTVRDLLDNQCIVVSTTFIQYDKALSALKAPPKLIITDSQLFAQIYPKKPNTSLLTSFSVLFSKYKGDIKRFIEGAKILDALNEDSRILIAEACTHKPLHEDIGRVKLPRLIKNKIHEKVQIDIVSGNDFPNNLSPYDIIIHCGACMFNRKHVMSRVEQAVEAGVPITNYGIAIAKLSGILEYIDY